MQNNEIIQILDKQTIESMIYTIRGQKVMLDFDLAKIYGYSTKAFNQQVERNVDKFPNRYRFQLTEEEQDMVLWSQNVTANKITMRRNLPYAFTEQGIYMLMTVLKGDLATKQSIALIDTFKEMKDYLIENHSFEEVNEVIKLTNVVNEHSNRIDKIENKLDVVMENFIDESSYKHFVIKDGDKIEADIAYQNIYKKAKKEIIIIDDYIDIKTLQHLKVIKEGVKVIIISDNIAKNNINNNYLKDANMNIIFKRNGIFHDRYIVLDYNTDYEEIYHCGASSKDAGNKVGAINKVNDKSVYKELIERALKNQSYSIR